MKNYKAPKGFINTAVEGWDHIEDEAIVYIDPNYVAEDESPRKYFVSHLTRGFCLIADTKKELRDGVGNIYSIYDVAYYKNAY